jgi:tetratricopeptide (TPR) repeat protein
MRSGDGPTTARTTTDLNAAIAAARALLGAQPDVAAAKARQILAIAPGRLDASLLLGAALRRAGDPAAAAKTLQPLAKAKPGVWGLQFELGAARAALGDTESAIEALRRATALNPQSSLAWHALGDQLEVAGDQAGADAARSKPLSGSMADPWFQAGATALFDGDLAKADEILNGRFDLHPTDVTAVRLLADLAVRMNRFDAAEGLLRPLLSSAPAFLPAQYAYCIILLIRNEPVAALARLQPLLALSPRSPPFHSLLGAIRLRMGDYDAAVADFALALDRDPSLARVWVSYGHALRTVGRQAESVAAYRRSLSLNPTLGEAYWSLANLKVVRFTDEDRQALQSAVAIAEQGGAAPSSADLSEDDRANLHFALGKALEDEKRFEASFAQYAKGNAIRRAMGPYDAAANRDYVRRNVEVFTEAFFKAHAGVGEPAADPIFVLGMPRSGSTLIEQILSCHSRVEGVSELPDLIAIAIRISADHLKARGEPCPPGDDVRPLGAHYPAMLSDLAPDAFARLGAEFIARTRVYRKLGRPFFVDKLPNNFMQTGLIHLILPNAKIIDARRHPIACCFSGFKQNFARGAQYSYDLTDLGHYYSDYVDLMAHFDAVLPGRVHRVQYERLIEAPEAEVRRLLDYCGLDFEPACLRFYDSKRPVHTPSSEQVRRPLFTEGVDYWRNFEPWLGPLMRALGPDLASV